MVVITIIAIASAMIIPEMKGTFQDALLRSTSRSLADALNIAYSETVSLNQSHRLRLDVATGRLHSRTPDTHGGAGAIRTADWRRWR